MPGKAALGPLEENEATLGDSTPSPTTVTVGEIFTTGFLARDEKTHMNTWRNKNKICSCYSRQRDLLFHVHVREDSMCDLKIHQHAGHNAFAVSQNFEEVGSVVCKDEALRASRDGKVDGIRNCYRGRNVCIRWCIAQHDFAGDVAQRYGFRVAAAQTL